MKNYQIETTFKGYFVRVGDEPLFGPYKNEESAKRRIRDLKRKDNEATVSLGAAIEDAPMAVPLRTVDHDALKLASSSEYGNVDPGWINPPFNPQPFKLDEQSFMNAVVRPIGCYPAISKHAYQR